MNSQQAKFILQGYRANGSDAGDSIFSEALEFARHDPALREWFAREQTFDAKISAKLGEVRAPAGLREAILAGARVTASDVTNRSWWRSPVWLAAAASVAAIFAVTVVLWPKKTLDSEFTQFAMADASHAQSHGGRGEQVGALQAAMSQPSTRLGNSLPVDFALLRKTGCRTLGFKGRDVLEVCFERDGIWFHCYIARRADFPSLAMTAIPELLQRGGVAGASWADAAHLYVLVSDHGRSALEKLL